MLGDVPDDARVFHEEIFGPVAPVGGFESEEEAIARANDTEYGLVAYVFTRDIKRAIRVCEGLDTGMVGLNQGMVSNAGAPFGGVKQSRHRPRGRPRGPRGVPRDEVRGREPVALERVRACNIARRSFSSVASVRGRPEGEGVPSIRVISGGSHWRWLLCWLLFPPPPSQAPRSQRFRLR